MSKKLAIVQSNYIPWKGYFDLINSVDEFILFDDVQYTRRDWRNRNKIKTSNGLMWLTIPVEAKGRYHQKIKEIVISDPKWNRKHWETLIHNYSKTKYFHTYTHFFKGLYLDCDEKFLSQVNYRFLKGICEILGIKTRLSWSMEYHLVEGKNERLIDLCKQASAESHRVANNPKEYGLFLCGL